MSGAGMAIYERGMELGKKQGIELGTEQGINKERVAFISKFIQRMEQRGMDFDQIIAELKDIFQLTDEDLIHLGFLEG